VVTVDGSRYGEDDVIAAIDAGADDVSEDDDLLRVLSEPAALSAVREALESAGVEVQSSEVTMEPKSTVEVDKSDARALLGLLDALDEHDDVSEVHANFDIPDAVMNEIAA
jgi:transcriptional/translational regulatory protein YebC/TACO1